MNTFITCSQTIVPWHGLSIHSFVREDSCTNTASLHLSSSPEEKGEHVVSIMVISLLWSTRFHMCSSVILPENDSLFWKEFPNASCSCPIMKRPSGPMLLELFRPLPRETTSPSVKRAHRPPFRFQVTHTECQDSSRLKASWYGPWIPCTSTASWTRLPRISLARSWNALTCVPE